MHVGARGDRGDQIAAADARQFFGDCERDRHGRDADMSARADIIVVEHMAEAAVHERRPRRRRFIAEPHNVLSGLPSMSRT